MKKTLYTLLALFFLCAFQHAQHKIEMKLSKGQIYRHILNMDMNIKQTVQGTEMDINMKMKCHVVYKVKEAVNSIYDIEASYEKLSMDMGMSGNIMSFDSEKKDDSHPLAAVLGAMVNKPFTMKMNSAGKVLEVKGIDTMFANMFDKMPNLTEEQKEQFKTQFSQAYGEKTLKGNFDMTTAIFPSRAVTVGDTWHMHSKLESSMPLSIKTVYKLKSVSDSAYHITGESDMMTTDNDKYTEISGMAMRYDMKGTMQIEIAVNKKTGWILNGNVKQNFEGKAFIKDSPTIPGGMELPMKISMVMGITD